MSVRLTNNFLRLLVYFRRQDLVNFFNEHNRLYAEAKRTGDYVPVTEHYYSIMSTVINEYFNGNFHFVAPLSSSTLASAEGGDQRSPHTIDAIVRAETKQSMEMKNAPPSLIDANFATAHSTKTHPTESALLTKEAKKEEAAMGKRKRKWWWWRKTEKAGDRVRTLEEALQLLHKRIGRLLGLADGRKCVDIGCGIGGVMLDLAPTGAHLTGLTVAPNDVAYGNELMAARGFGATCRLVLSACEQYMPLEDESQDAAYAIYALKYFPSLRPVLAEASRILKRGARFVVYELLKSERFDSENAEHCRLLEALEHACGMPSLHTRAELVETAAACGLTLATYIDVDAETGLPFYYCFTSAPFFMWLCRSAFIRAFIRAGEAARVLPRGFADFNRVFLAGTVDAIVASGEAGILTGGEIFVFEKQ